MICRTSPRCEVELDFSREIEYDGKGLREENSCMQDRKDGKKKGVLLTLLGGTLWGVCGSCGQFLMQYKGVTSDWLVPWRLTLAGAVILLFLFATEKGRTLDVWKED